MQFRDYINEKYINESKDDPTPHQMLTKHGFKRESDDESNMVAKYKHSDGSTVEHLYNASSKKNGQISLTHRKNGKAVFHSMDRNTFHDHLKKYYGDKKE
jgi:hypothetical protein